MLEDDPRKAPKLDDPVEAAHALMEMQVFIAAYQQGGKVELEKGAPLCRVTEHPRGRFCMRARSSLRWNSKPA